MLDVYWELNVSTNGMETYLFCTDIIYRLRPRQSGRHYADGILKCIFLDDNFRSSNNISLKCVSCVLIDNMSSFPSQCYLKLYPYNLLINEPTVRINQTIYIYIYIYIIVEKSPNSSHMYDHGFMDNTNRQAVCKSQKNPLSDSQTAEELHWKP